MVHLATSHVDNRLEDEREILLVDGLPQLETRSMASSMID